MTLADTVTLLVDGVDAPFRVLSLTGSERLHAPFRFEVTCGFAPGEAPPPPLAAESVAGQKAKLAFALPDGGERAVYGLVRRFSARYRGYAFTIEPHVALLGDTTDHQSFLAEDAIAIALAVFAEHGIDAASEVSRALVKRDQCVQAFETDLDFVARILAEEGVFFCVRHDSGKEVVTLVDDPTSYADIVGDPKLPYREDTGLVEGEHVASLVLKKRVVTTKVSLRDFDFAKPDLDQTASAGDGAFERYEFPGGYSDPAAGKDLAAIRLSEAQSGQLVVQGESNSTRIEVGKVIEIEGSPRDEINARWLVVAATFTAAEAPGAADRSRRFSVAFEAVPATRPFRPARLARAQFGGAQTATVTGAAGAEVHTDESARMKMQFRSERRRANDDTASHWVRAVHPPLSGGVALPRVGWETLVAFVGQSGDAPVELGRVYNGAATPPESLPAGNVSSALGTLTTPGGGSSNLLRLFDAAGSEAIHMIASKDFTEASANDKAAYVSANEFFSTGADHLLNVGSVFSFKVGGVHKYKIGTDRVISVKEERETKASLDVVTIGGARIITIGDDYKTSTHAMIRNVGAAKSVLPLEQHSRKITGASVQLVGGTWQQQTSSAAVAVLGASRETIGAAKIIRAKSYELKAKKLTQTFGFREVEATGGEIETKADGAIDYGSSGTIDVDAKDGIVVTATSSITIKAGGVNIFIEAGKVTIEGKMDEPEVLVEGDTKYDGS